MKGSTNGDGTVVCLCTTAPIDNINALLIADLVHRDRAKSASLFRNKFLDLSIHRNRLAIIGLRT